MHDDNTMLWATKDKDGDELAIHARPSGMIYAQQYRPYIDDGRFRSTDLTRADLVRLRKALKKYLKSTKGSK